MHENVTIGEVLVNGDVWKPQARAGAHQDEWQRNLRQKWWRSGHAASERRRAEGAAEARRAHPATPGDILVEFLKTWDKVAAEEAAKSPFFKKTHESQRQYASLVVPAKRFMFPPYSFAANYYFPEKAAGGTAKAEAKQK